ncbi:hypothetical protein AAC387_Pa11g1347 [Persea americana]
MGQAEDLGVGREGMGAGSKEEETEQSDKFEAEVAEGARLQGASKIIGVDLIPEKFETGKIFGLTDFINRADCGEKAVSEVIMEMTNGDADYCFECDWGQTIILGVEMHGSPIPVNSSAILRGKTMKGALFGGLKAKSDIPLLVKINKDKELHLDEFVTHEVGLRDINKAFDLLLQGKSLRCIIWMDK